MKGQVSDLCLDLADESRQVDTGRKHLVMSRIFRENVHFMHINNGVLIA